MNHGRILARAWTLMWHSRALWFFGFLFALAGGTQANSSFNWSQSASRGTSTGPNGSNPFRSFTFSSIDWTTVFWIAGAVLLVLLLLAVVFTILRYLSETALMAGANEIESTGAPLSIRRGFRLGWSRPAGRLFLTDLVIHLPLAIAAFLLLAAGALPLLLWFSHQVPLGVIGTALTVALELLVVFALLAVSLVLSVIMPYLRRRVVLDQQAPLAALRQSARLVRASLLDTGLMWLLLAGLRILWSVVMIPVVLVLVVVAATVGGIPAVAAYLLSHSLVWTVAVGLPLFLLVLIPAGAFVAGLFETYVSTSWTLTYREALSKFGDALVARPA